VNKAPLGILQVIVIFVTTAPGDDKLGRIAFVLVGKLFTWNWAWALGMYAQPSLMLAHYLDLERFHAKGQII
jgi:hypothetical protein